MAYDVFRPSYYDPRDFEHGSMGYSFFLLVPASVLAYAAGAVAGFQLAASPKVRADVKKRQRLVRACAVAFTLVSMAVVAALAKSTIDLLEPPPVDQYITRDRAKVNNYAAALLVAAFIAFLSLCLTTALLKGHLSGLDDFLAQNHFNRRECSTLLLVLCIVLVINLVFLVVNLQKLVNGYLNPTVTTSFKTMTQLPPSISYPELAFSRSNFLQPSCILAQPSPSRRVPCGFTSDDREWHWQILDPWQNPMVFVVDFDLLYLPNIRAPCGELRIDGLAEGSQAEFMLCNNTQSLLTIQYVVEDKTGLFGDVHWTTKATIESFPIIDPEQDSDMFRNFRQREGTVRIYYRAGGISRQAQYSIYKSDLDLAAFGAQQASIFNITLTLFAFCFPVIYAAESSRVFTLSGQQPFHRPKENDSEEPAVDEPDVEDGRATPLLPSHSREFTSST